MWLQFSILSSEMEADHSFMHYCVSVLWWGTILLLWGPLLFCRARKCIFKVMTCLKVRLRLRLVGSNVGTTYG